MNIDSPDVERIQIAAQATRLHLLKLLLDEDSYAGKLGQELKIDRKVVAFHLKELQKRDLVEGKAALHKDRYKRDVAIKQYKITPLGKRIYAHILSFK